MASVTVEKAHHVFERGAEIQAVAVLLDIADVRRAEHIGQ